MHGQQYIKKSTLCFGIELISAFHDCASFQTVKRSALFQVDLRWLSVRQHHC